MPVTASLCADAISRSFKGYKAVNAASLTLAPGQITALIGPSGSGKTTILRLLAGMERPDAGHIRLGQTVLASPSEHVPIEKRRIGLVFQDFALFPHFTVLENVMFGLSHRDKSERIAIAERWIGRLDLSHRRDTYPHHLSGGEQQRTAIARALAPQPVAILLDEPFSGLDPAMRERAREVALGAVRDAGIPALLVTHDASEALVHADLVAVVDQGRIRQVGPPETVYRQPNGLDVARALGPVHEIAREALPEAWRAGLAGQSDALWYRPEAIQLRDGLALTVSATKLAGPVTEIAFTLASGARLFAACQPGTLPPVGTQVEVAINPDLFFDFAAETI